MARRLERGGKNIAPSELENALKEMGRNPPDALLNGMSSGLLFQNRQFTNETALRLGIPAAGNVAAGAQSGALFSLGVNLHNEFRRAASHAARILRGANPGDLPVEQPTRFELHLNLKTAKALGLRIPQSVLIRADQVID